MTRIDYVMREENSTPEQTLDIVVHHCPGFFLDNTISAFPLNRSIKKCPNIPINPTDVFAKCIPCWNKEYEEEDNDNNPKK